MKSILLIGAGQFGVHLAKKLNELGHEIMAVDSQEERVDRILPYCTSAQIGDASSAEFWKRWALRITTFASLPSAIIFRIRWRPHPL